MNLRRIVDFVTVRVRLQFSDPHVQSGGIMQRPGKSSKVLLRFFAALFTGQRYAWAPGILGAKNGPSFRERDSEHRRIARNRFAFRQPRRDK